MFLRISDHDVGGIYQRITDRLLIVLQRERSLGNIFPSSYEFNPRQSPTAFPVKLCEHNACDTSQSNMVLSLDRRFDEALCPSSFSVCSCGGPLFLFLIRLDLLVEKERTHARALFF